MNTLVCIEYVIKCDEYDNTYLEVKRVLFNKTVVDNIIQILDNTGWFATATSEAFQLYFYLDKTDTSKWNIRENSALLPNFKKALHGAIPYIREYKLDKILHI